MHKTYLIVGLGNPGAEYVNTRHNIGFQIVQDLAEKNGLLFKKEASFQAYVAQGKIGNTKVILALPTTYMNRSGKAVSLCMHYFKMLPESLISVSDDISLPFGKLRIRKEGSSGGHNGLKSIQEALQTSSFCRLKVGVGAPDQIPLSDFVLGGFNSLEKEKLPQVLDQASRTLSCWLEEGVDAAIKIIEYEKRKGELTNAKRSQKSL